MLGSDLVLGFFLAKLFGKNGGAPAAVSPAVVHNGHARAHHAHAAAPATHTQPAAFPANVEVPSSSTTAPAGFKKALEVWAVRPDVAAMQSSPALTQTIGQVNDATALSALEASFPAGWAPVQRVTAAEQAQAIALLKQWHDGGVVFLGPSTLTGRRAYRMTKHPAGASSSTPAPVPVPSQPGQTVPASFPVQVTPATPPTHPHPHQGPHAAPATAPSSQAIVTVQKDEGLAQIAKRLGQPASADSAKALRAANVPNGPDGHTWVATSLTDPKTRGMKRTDRTGGLQPGDRLFVPTAWGTT